MQSNPYFDLIEVFIRLALRIINYLGYLGRRLLIYYRHSLNIFLSLYLFIFLFTLQIQVQNLRNTIQTF